MSGKTILENLLLNKNNKGLSIIDQPSILLPFTGNNNSGEIFGISQILACAQGINKKFQTSKEKEGVRKFYYNLKNDVTNLLTSIQKCFDQRKFTLSQFFQYQQLVLKSFFQAFLEHLSIQCKQEWQFVDFIWNRNTQMAHNAFQKYQALDSAYELEKCTQLRDTHVKYSEFMAKQAEKIKEQNLSHFNLKNIIQILVQKLRIRRKEVKKLFRETQQLILIVNQFKDKNIQLEMKYLNLMQSSVVGSNDFEINQIAQKKERLNYVYREILTLENSLYKNTKAFQHEVNLEGPLQAEDFIKEASEIIHGSAVSNEEIKAQIDIILDKYEQDFQDTLLRLKRTTKKKIHAFQEPEPFCQTSFKASNGLMCYHCNQSLLKPERVSRSTQITNVDKHCNNLIKSIATSANFRLDQKPIMKNFGTQCEATIKLMRANGKTRCLLITKTVELCIKRKNHKNKNSILNKKFNKSSEHKEKERRESESEQAKQESLEIISSESSKQSHNGDIMIGSLKKKRNQVHKGNKSRFSLGQSHPRRPSYLNTISSEMQQIQEEQREDHSKNQRKGQKRNSSASSFHPSKPSPGRKNSLGNEYFPHRDIKEGCNIQNAIKHELKSNSSGNDQKNLMEQMKNQGSSKKRTASLSRFSQLKKISSSSKYRSSEQKRSLVAMRQDGNEPLFQRKDKVDQRRVSNIQKQYRQSFSQAKRSVAKWRRSKLDGKNKRTQQEQGFVELTIKKAFQKVYPKISPGNQKQNILIGKQVMEVISQARSKCQEYELKTKKLSFFIKHNNAINIINSVYSRALQKLNANGKVSDFVEPLYESMMVMYGNIPKEEISKKISNFIAQVAYRRKDPFCRSFAFLLGVDQDANTDQITTFENHLYLHLIVKLSNTDSPFEDTQNVVTDLNRITEMAPIVFQAHDIGPNIQKEIVAKIVKAIENEAADKEDALGTSSKVNLFSCCKFIVKELLKIKKTIKETFVEFLFNLTRSKGQISHQHVHKIVQILSLNKIEEVVSMNKILRISRKKSELFDMNQFSTAMLTLNIRCFEDYCAAMLEKFKIVDNSKRKEMIKQWEIYNKHEKTTTQNTFNVLLLKIVEEKSSELLENLMGDDLTQLFSVSILKTCGM